MTNQIYPIEFTSAKTLNEANLRSIYNQSSSLNGGDNGNSGNVPSGSNTGNTNGLRNVNNTGD